MPQERGELQPLQQQQQLLEFFRNAITSPKSTRPAQLAAEHQRKIEELNQILPADTRITKSFRELIIEDLEDIYFPFYQGTVASLEAGGYPYLTDPHGGIYAPAKEVRMNLDKQRYLKEAGFAASLEGFAFITNPRRFNEKESKKFKDWREEFEQVYGEELIQHGEPQIP